MGTLSDAEKDAMAAAIPEHRALLRIYSVANADDDIQIVRRYCVFLPAHPHM